MRSEWIRGEVRKGVERDEWKRGKRSEEEKEEVGGGGGEYKRQYRGWLNSE